MVAYRPHGDAAAPYHRVVTHYEVLGVDPSAGPRQIRAAYVDAARRHHPDFHLDADRPARDAAGQRMGRLNEAWAVLSDPAQRRAYDTSLRALARSQWEPGTVHPDFVPVDTGGRGGGVLDTDDEDDDPAAAFDTPIAGALPPPKWQQMAPACLLVAAVVVAVVGMLTAMRSAIALAVVLFVAALASFILAPMLEVLRSASRSRD